MNFVFFFFFKQKTAYEITRRDWSSDVCSSDLVQSVSLERVLPHTLRVRVSEREPIVQIYAPRPRGSLSAPIVYQLDAEGCIMPPLEGRQRSIPPNPAAEQLPLLAGARITELQP